MNMMLGSLRLDPQVTEPTGKYWTDISKVVFFQFDPEEVRHSVEIPWEIESDAPDPSMRLGHKLESEGSETIEFSVMFDDASSEGFQSCAEALDILTAFGLPHDDQVQKEKIPINPSKKIVTSEKPKLIPKSVTTVVRGPDFEFMLYEPTITEHFFIPNEPEKTKEETQYKEIPAHRFYGPTERLLLLTLYGAEPIRCIIKEMSVDVLRLRPQDGAVAAAVVHLKVQEVEEHTLEATITPSGDEDKEDSDTTSRQSLTGAKGD